MVAGQANQILPGGLFVGNGGERDAKSVGSQKWHKAVPVASEPNQILPGGLFVRKNGKISAQSIDRFSAIFDVIANALSMNLRLVDQIPAPQNL